MGIGLACGLALLAGCAQAPPVVVHGPELTVRCADEMRGRALGLHAQTLVASARQLLGSQRPLPSTWPEVWLVPGLEVPGLPPGAHAEGAIERDREGRPRRIVVHLGRSDALALETLVHEVVHALEPPGSRLPALLEEGLADWVGDRLVPEAGIGLRRLEAATLYGGIDLAISGRGLRGTLRLEPTGQPVPLRELLRFEEARSLYDAAGDDGRDQGLGLTYGAGWFLVDRILERCGLDGHSGRGLRPGLRSANSVQAVLERAGIADEAELSAQAALALVARPDGLRRLIEDLAHDIAAALVAPVREAFRGQVPPLPRFLELEPVLGLQGVGVPIAACPRLCAALRLRWPTR